MGQAWVKRRQVGSAVFWSLEESKGYQQRAVLSVLLRWWIYLIYLRCAPVFMDRWFLGHVEWSKEKEVPWIGSVWLQW